MTIKDLREIYEGSSTKASDINRKLIFAGIAIIWIFRKTTNLGAGEIFPDECKPILLLFCISLCLDIMQYIVRAVMWHIYYYFHRVPEAEEATTQAKEPEWLNSFPDSFWYAKFVPTILAYINLARLLSLQSIEQSKWMTILSGWKVLGIWGIILASLLIWYAITDAISKNQKQVLCICLRIAMGLVIAAISLIELWSM